MAEKEEKIVDRDFTKHPVAKVHLQANIVIGRHVLDLKRKSFTSLQPAAI